MELIYEISKEEYISLFKQKRSKKMTPTDKLILDFVQSNAKYAKVSFEADDVVKVDAKQARLSSSIKRLGVKSVKAVRRGDVVFLVRKSKKKEEIDADSFKWLKWEE